MGTGEYGIWSLGGILRWKVPLGNERGKVVVRGGIFQCGSSRWNSFERLQGWGNNSCLQLRSTACVSSTSYLPASLDLFRILGSGCCWHSHCPEAESEAKGLHSLGRTMERLWGRNQDWSPGAGHWEGGIGSQWHWEVEVLSVCACSVAMEMAGENAGRMEDPRAGKNRQT